MAIGAVERGRQDQWGGSDFHRRDLWNAIQAGDFPEWELNLQVFDQNLPTVLILMCWIPPRLFLKRFSPDTGRPIGAESHAG
nr:catalase [Brucella pituitosa]